MNAEKCGYCGGMVDIPLEWKNSKCHDDAKAESVQGRWESHR